MKMGGKDTDLKTGVLGPEHHVGMTWIIKRKRNVCQENARTSSSVWQRHLDG